MDLFKFDDYKEALKIYLRHKGVKGAFKNIAEYLGVNPTLVSQILSGPRNFSEEQIFSVCEYLGIPKLESQFLLTLVQIERAGTFKLKNHYLGVRDQLRQKAVLVENRVLKTRELSDAEKAQFYSDYLYSAIQIATSLEDHIDFDFLVKRFQIKPAQAQAIVDFLLETNLIKAKEDRFVPGTNFTHLQKNSPFVHKHLTNWRLKAIDSARDATEEEMFYSVNFSIAKKDFKILRDKMTQVIQDFMKIIEPSPAEDIAQFNIDLFWIKK